MIEPHNLKEYGRNSVIEHNGLLLFLFTFTNFVNNNGLTLLQQTLEFFVFFFEHLVLASHCTHTVIAAFSNQWKLTSCS